VPRKPSLGPPVLRIENLSTGIDTDMRDDFTGAVLPQPEAKVPQSAQEILDAINVAKHRDNQLLLQAAGILPKDGRLCTHGPDGRLSQPIARPWTDRFAYHNRTSVRRMAGCEGGAEVRLSQPAIPKAKGRTFTKLILTRKPQDWRRI
jgi:hypothetical protein